MTDQTRSAGTCAAGTDDLVLLRRYAERGDAEAFQELVERYQNLVWSACRRVLGDSCDAEDAAQSVFLAMAKNATLIESNLAAWLHATSVNRSTSLVRTDAARRKHEQRHAESLVNIEDERAWKEVRDAIDVCLAELNDDDRELVMQRFYRGMTQAEIGERLGISQQAVAVRLGKIVDQLRRGLRKRGLPVTATALASALHAGLAEALVPAHIAEGLAKVGISGIGCARLPAATSLAIAGKSALVIAPVVICLVAAWFYWGSSGVDINSVLAQLDTARSIQYTKTRTNSVNAQTEPIGPQDVLDISTQRYYILDGYLERVDDLDENGNVVGTMIANYRTGEVVRFNMRAKTYTTNVKLRRQVRSVLPVPNQAAGPKLAPQTDLSSYLEQFTPDAAEVLATRTVDGRALVGLRTETKQGASVWKRTAWIDRETMRPMSTLVTFRNEHPMIGASDWVCDNFVFDAELPQSLISTEPPKGFTLRNMVRSDGGKISGIPLP